MKEKFRRKNFIEYLLRYIGAPILLEFVIESLNRKSVAACVQYMVEKPLLFVFNTLIILLTLSIALFFKREHFVFAMVSVVWLLFGIINFCILQMRVTPFSFVDITLLKSAIQVSGHYLNAMNIAMIFVAAALVLALMVCLWRKAPRHTQLTGRSRILAGVLCFAIAFAILLLRQSSSVQALSTQYTNISEAYENYGFVYCFTNSILDTGIGEPEDYSEERVEEILDSLSAVETKSADTPNIIFVQLESFFDVDEVKGLELSDDAIPNFHRLEEDYSHGLLTVPTVGAGTVNTEFEVLTGMSQRDFGTSEYPYKTVLRNTTAESICYNLKSLGYTSHCVHNNTGTFYGRNKVFQNLGFDTFTSMEFMNGLEDNPNGWKKDSTMAQEIIASLDSTKGADFTLGITVQTHGKYQGFTSDTDSTVQVLAAPGEAQENIDAWQYYISQMYETDQMIGELVSALEEREEETILVLYGDHLPSLDLEKSDLKNSNLYQTQYVIWDNMGLSAKEKDLTSYQLSAYVLKRIGISEGNITKLHQSSNWKVKSYADELKTLEYDMLYGKQYAYDGESPYEATELTMGTEELTISGIVKNGSGYLLSGSGFTAYTHVYFNGKELASEWVDGTHMQLTEEPVYDEEAAARENDLQNANAFQVKIESDGGTVYRESDFFSWETLLK